MMDRVAYLDAKRGVDDRALNLRVLSVAFDPLSNDPSVLEVGAGTLTMVERLHDWGVLESGEWTAVDSDDDALRRGRARLLDRPDATAAGGDGRLGGVRLGDIDVHVLEADVFACETLPAAELLVGCAFFDIVDLDRLSVVRPLVDRVYAPITYDGTTTFEPADPADEVVLDAYRKHMLDYREGTPDGGDALRETLAVVEAVGPSPWRIEPPYHAGEGRVLEYLIGTIETAVAEVGPDPEGWADRRRAQLAAGRLTYRASNVDIVGRL